MRNWIGLLLIIIGFCSGVYHFTEWLHGKNAIQYVSEKELGQYQQVKAEKLTAIPEQTSPLPASKMNVQMGEEVAVLVIPEITQKYPVFWGADEKTLKKGVGMFVSDLTTPPNGNGHTVLSGHRDTVFTKLGKLKEKDELLLKYDGSIYVYEINKIWITDKDDRSVIVKKDQSVLTLITCYPFTYIGLAPDRYIIQANLIAVNK